MPLDRVPRKEDERQLNSPRDERERKSSLFGADMLSNYATKEADAGIKMRMATGDYVSQKERKISIVSHELHQKQRAASSDRDRKTSVYGADMLGNYARKQSNVSGPRDVHFKDVVYAHDENKERGNWTRSVDFVLSAIGYAVGLGNVWRFPYLCYKNGGGAFLVPYTIMLVLAGLPIFYLEIAWGQFASLGPITIWKIAPIFKGIGYAMVIASSLKCMYYNMILAYTIFYFFASFSSSVPWASCDNSWNTIACTKYVYDFINCTNVTLPEGNITEVCADVRNLTDGPKTPADEYFHNYVLELTDSIDDVGTLRWPLVLCYLLSWIVIFLCLIKGHKSIGRVVWFTALFPYVVLTILLIRGVTLPGALEGVKFYIIPNFSRISDAQVWGDAAVQIFYSLGPAYGGLIVMASYNRFNNNCYKDAIIIAVVNCLTSIYAGFAIFSVVGFMAYSLGVKVSDATASGAGLVFVAYPEGIARMPGAPVWAVIFFFMLWVLGLDSMFAMMETIMSAFADEFPRYLRKKKIWFTLFVSLLFFVIGLAMCTQGGIYVLTIMDGHSAGFPLLFIALFECLILMHVYGYNKFASDIESMIGSRPNIYWRLTWMLLAPMSIIFIIIFKVVNLKGLGYDDYKFPPWADGVSWALVIFDLSLIPVFMVRESHKAYKAYKAQGVKLSPWQALRYGSDSGGYGPALVQHARITSRGTQTDSWVTDPVVVLDRVDENYVESSTDASVPNGMHRPSSILKVDHGSDPNTKVYENGTMTSL